MLMYGDDAFDFMSAGTIYFDTTGKVLKVVVYIKHVLGEELPVPAGATIDECKQLVEVTLRLAHPEWFNGEEVTYG